MAREDSTMRHWALIWAILLGAAAWRQTVCAGAPAQGPFPDVPVAHWAYDAVNELTALGIVHGYPDGTFRGGSAITRYELALLFHSFTIANPGLGAAPPP